MSGKKVVYQTQKGTKRNVWSTNKIKAGEHRPLNRCEAETDFEGVSTSAKKLKMTDDVFDIRSDKTFSYCFINFATVFSAISELVVCKTCHSKVKFYESHKRGLGFKIDIVCEKCEPHSVPNSPFIRNAYEINRRIVLAMRLLGVGLNGLLKFCAFMDLPRPMFQSLYDSIINAISVATEAVRKQSTERAVEQEKTIATEKGQVDGITVSSVCSWRKCGFSLLIGLVSLIGWHTGKVIDIEVKSKYCKECEFWKQKEDTKEYLQWLESHQESCQLNREGSTEKMEVDAVIEMFKRSEDLYNIKYINYIGDGNSKIFKEILDAQPYENTTVEKKECIYHVQKRMTTRLRNLKKSKKDLVGQGNLTRKLIYELSKYYGLAIRRNFMSIEKMKNDIWATLYHRISTNEKPQHDKCPPGENSWCTWQKAKATNTLDRYQHTAPLSSEVFEAIKPVYEELSNDELLNHCLGGYTQNSNKSFNSTVWSIAPKSSSNGKKVLQICADLAICMFNDGTASIMRVMEVLGITIGDNVLNFCIEADATRIELSERSLTDEAKEARTALKSTRELEEEESANKEGQVYGSGIAE